MIAKKSSLEKPLFFVHTIDPILWVYLMIFIRPFFRIVCFQFRNVKEIGFQRLKISSLTEDEYEQCHLDGLKFARANHFEQRCSIFGSVTSQKLDFTNYFAKEILRSYIDLLLSAKMIRKNKNPYGVFILTRQFFGRDIRSKVAESVAKASGLKYVGTLWTIFRWLQIPLRVVLAFFSFWAAVGVILLRKKKTPRISLDDKIIVVANNVSELQTDLIKQLSAGFMIDGNIIKKEDVIFLSRRGPEAGEWRKEGFLAFNLIDLAGRYIHAEAIFRLLIFFIQHLKLSVGLIVFFPQWVMYYLVLSDILVKNHKFRGLIYTNSDVMIEPIFSVPFLAREIPVILFYYSASTFPNAMWAYLQASHIFVWNENMVKFLKDHPQSRIEEKKFFLSGPLMQVEDQIEPPVLSMMCKERKIPFKTGNGLNIGVFDIAAVKTDYLEQVRFVQNPKLTSEIHRDFFMDIFSLGEKDPDMRFLLKPKRWTPKHDLSIELTEYLKTNSDQPILLPPMLNPQIAIQSSDIVICFPFTSIFFAAVQKGIPAIFYYPYEDEGLKKVAEMQPHTIYGKAKLHAWFNTINMNQDSHMRADYVLQLCGIPLNTPVRKNFILQLKTILYDA